MITIWCSHLIDPQIYEMIQDRWWHYEMSLYISDVHEIHINICISSLANIDAIMVRIWTLTEWLYVGSNSNNVALNIPCNYIDISFPILSSHHMMLVLNWSTNTWDYSRWALSMWNAMVHIRSTWMQYKHVHRESRKHRCNYGPNLNLDRMILCRK